MLLSDIKLLFFESNSFPYLTFFSLDLSNLPKEPITMKPVWQDGLIIFSKFSLENLPNSINFVKVG